MRTIKKGRPPRSLVEYRNKADASYENYPDKKELREQLCSEQQGLCCYCQSRIRATHDGMKIEHWQSQSPKKFPERQLDYQNLLGACYGGQRSGIRSPRETHHCDTLKGDDDLCFCLTDTAHPIEGNIHFLGDGRIHATDGGI